MLLRTYRGEDVLRTVPIEIPANASGSLSVLVSDGQRLGAGRAARGARRRSRAASPQLMRALNKGRRNNTLYVKLLERRSRRGRQRRAAVVAAAVGARRARSRSQRRQLQPAQQRDARRVGARRPSTPSAASRTLHDSGLAELTRAVILLLDLAHVASSGVRSLSCIADRRRRPSLRSTPRRPKFFQAATQADFLKGDVENLSIDSRGQLVLGPATELVYETAAPFLWAIVAGADGSLFVGTGNEGRVFRDRSRRARARSFFDAPSSKRTRWRRRRTAASTSARSPDGKIYKVDRERRRRRRSSSPANKYIWALAVDAEGQSVRRHRREGRRSTSIAPDGKGARFYQTKATHATALAFDTARQPARRHRVARPGAARRSRGQGVRAARLAVPGDPRAAVRRQGHALRGGGQRPAPAATRPAPRPTSGPTEPRRRAVARAGAVGVTTEITSIAVVDVSGGRRPAARRARIGARAKGAVYRIAPDGLWDQLWESRDDSPYDLDLRRRAAADRRHRQQGQDLPARGRSAAADAARARRARSRSPRSTRTRAAACTSRPRIPGKLFRLSAERAPRGHLRVGAARRADGVDLGRDQLARHDAGRQPRSRSSRAPATPRRPTTRGARGRRRTPTANGSPITSPKARYLQWRAVLTGKSDSPVLTSVTRRVPAAQPAARGAVDHGPSARHRVPEAVHAPAIPTSPASTTRRRPSAS